MASVRILVDGVPAAKGRPRIGRAKGSGQTIAYTPTKTKNYETLVKFYASQAMFGKAPLDESVDVRILAIIPVPRSWSKKKRKAALDGRYFPNSRPDLDNYVKAALDGCNGVVFTDDARVIRLVAEKNYGEKPRLEIEVTPIRVAHDD